MLENGNLNDEVFWSSQLSFQTLSVVEACYDINPFSKEKGFFILHKAAEKYSNNLVLCIARFYLMCIFVKNYYEKITPCNDNV